MRKKNDNTGLVHARVFITRPVGQGTALARRILALGGCPVALPATSIKPMPADAGLIARLDLVGKYPKAVFTSPNAVRWAFKAHPQWRIADASRVFAVGRATARLLERKGIIAAAPRASFDSEGLLALPELAAGGASRVAIIGAPGGRGLLQKALARRGFEVLDVHVYRRVPAKLGPRHFSGLKPVAGKTDISIWSSEESLALIAGRLTPERWRFIVSTIAIASSQRIARAARSLGFRRIAVADSAATPDLLAATINALTNA